MEKNARAQISVVGRLRKAVYKQLEEKTSRLESQLLFSKRLFANLVNTVYILVQVLVPRVVLSPGKAMGCDSVTFTDSGLALAIGS